MFSKARVFSLVVLLWLFSSFLCPDNGFGLSIEEEEKLGKEFLSKVKKEFEFLDEPSVNCFLADLVEHLWTSEDNKPFNIKVYVIKKHDMNAFAGPGGHLFFFSGILEQLDSVDQVAGVVAHELAHVAFRHLSNRIAQSYKVGLASLGGMLLGALLGGAPGEAVMAGSMAAGMQMQLSYSREDERQADQLGLQYLHEAGFDPRELIDLHKNLQRYTQFAGNKIPPYLLTHPTGAERMANLDAMVQGIGPRKPSAYVEELRREYPFIRTVVMASVKDSEEAVRYFSELLEKKNKRPEYLLGLSIGLMAQGDAKEAQKALSEAIDLAPNVGLLRTFMARVLISSGEPKRAVNYLKDVLDRTPDAPEALYLLSEAYVDMGDEKTALTYLQRLAHMEAAGGTGLFKPDIYYKMGTIFGRQGKLDLAHYNLGLFYLKEEEPQKARFHLNKALSITDDEKLKETIKELLKQTNPGRKG